MFKARKVQKPPVFNVQDLSIYSSIYQFRAASKFADLMPILLAEGRKKVARFKTRGCQAGEDEFSDDEEYKKMGILDREYAMVI